jgi:Ca-activated chloride channel family protein
MLSISLDQKLVPAGAASVRNAVVRVVAPGRRDGVERDPVEVAFALDRSGSMADGRLVLAKKAVRDAIGKLGPRDRFAIVAYDDRVEVVFEATLATGEAKQAAFAALDLIEARNWTDLAAGWLTAATKLAGGMRLSRVILLTDGLANRGITDIVKLSEHAAELRKRGISTSTFGVGHDFNEALLQRMAAAGGGNFYFIGDAAQISDFMMSEFGEVLDVAATDVTLSVFHDEGVEVESLSVLSSEHAAGVLRLSLGSLVSDQEIEVVLRLRITAGEADREVKVACTSGDGVLSAAAAASFHAAPATEVAAETPDADVVRTVAAVDIARAQQEAVALNRAGDYGAALGVMHATILSYEGYAQHDTVLRSALGEATAASASYGSAMDEAHLKSTYWNASNTARGRTAVGAARRATPKA